MLDSPTSAAGNIHVVYLKNAEAVQRGRDAARDLSGRARADAGRLGGTARHGAGRPWAAGRRRSRTGAGELGGIGRLGHGGGMIQADPATNSIIITAPDAVYNNLRAVIDKLDVRRAQVYVEALIVEVTADKAAEFGIQWQSLQRLEHQRHAGVRRHQLRRRGRARTSSTSAANLGSVAPRPQHRHRARHGHHSRRGDHHSTSPRSPARSKPTPTPTSCRRRSC